MLGSRQKAVVERALREGLTNALRHARPRQVEVALRLAPDGVLHLAVRNDGAVGDPAHWPEGRGLRGMRQRLQAWGGEVRTAATAQGQAELAVRLPLEAQEIA